MKKQIIFLLGTALLFLLCSACSINKPLSGSLLYANDATAAGSLHMTENIAANAVNIYDFKTDKTVSFVLDNYDIIRNVISGNANDFWCVGRKNEINFILHVQNQQVIKAISIPFDFEKADIGNYFAFIQSGETLYQVDLQLDLIVQINDNVSKNAFYVSADDTLCFLKCINTENKYASNAFNLYIYENGQLREVCTVDSVLNWCGSNQILIKLENNGQKEAYVLDIESGEQTRQPKFDKYFGFAVFNPDYSTFICYYPSHETGGYQIVAVDFSTGKKKYLHNDGIWQLDRQTSESYVWS